MAKYEVIELKDAAGAQVKGMMKVDGRTILTFMKPPEVTAEVIHNMVNLPIRDDDVMFCSAIKSGTHWGFEVISMLLNGNTETIPIPKMFAMLEFASQNDLGKLPSPRVLNSHFPLCILPKQIKEKKTKIVLGLRNPKDTVVSLYHFHIGLIAHDYNGKFSDFLQLFMDGKLEYGDWFGYVLGMEKIMREKEYDIHPVYFEDLKENGLEEIKKIAKFLGVPENEELFLAIHDKCQFEKMKVAKSYQSEIVKKAAKHAVKTSEMFFEQKTNPFKEGFSLFRKGEIGDWKNHFTVAMSERFDKLYREKMKGSSLKFRYEPTSS